MRDPGRRQLDRLPPAVFRSERDGREDVAAQGLRKAPLEDTVGELEALPDLHEIGGQLREHAGVLRSLTGVEERQTTGRGQGLVVEEDLGRSLAVSLADERGSTRLQFGAEIVQRDRDDRQGASGMAALPRSAPDRYAEVGKARHGTRRQRGAADLDLLEQPGRAVGPQQEELGRPVVRHGLHVDTRDRLGVLLDGDVEVGAAEAEGADPRPPRGGTRGLDPGP